MRYFIFITSFVVLAPNFSLAKANLSDCLFALQELNIHPTTGFFDGGGLSLTPVTAYVPGINNNQPGFFAFNNFDHKFCEVPKRLRDKIRGPASPRNLRAQIFADQPEHKGRSYTTPIYYKLNKSDYGKSELQRSHLFPTDRTVRWKTVQCKSVKGPNSKAALKSFLEGEISRIPQHVAQKGNLQGAIQRDIKKQMEDLPEHKRRELQRDRFFIDGEFAASFRKNAEQALKVCERIPDINIKPAIQKARSNIARTPHDGIQFDEDNNAESSQ